MRQTTKRTLAAMMSTLMVFSLLPGVQTFAAEKETGTKAADTTYTWESRAFGQSTDLNFKSNVLPEKIGRQSADETKIKVTEGTETKEENAVIIESRGGKIANTHDGLTFYYTKIPTSKNFKLSANIYLNQLGPDEATGAKPNKQEGCGVMVRDCVAQARKDPMEFGYEELTAASNIVANMLLATDKKAGVAVNATLYERNGVLYPYGNAGTSKTSTKISAIDNFVTTKDVTPEDGVYDGSKFFTLTLERTNEGFITTYTNSKGEVISKSTDCADRVAVIDKDYMYAGFFASRNAKMTVKDIVLTTSDAKTVQQGYTAAPYAGVLDLCSAKTTSTEDYTVRLRSNYDGTVAIKQDGKEIATNATAKAAEFFEQKTLLTNEQTTFEITYTMNDTAKTVKTESFTVIKNNKFANKDLYIAVDGSATGEGTVESPLDLKTALDYVSDGHTVYAKAGTYSALEMNENYTASAAKKTLCAYNNDKVVFSGTSKVDASNWYFKGLEFTGSDTTGFRLTGHNNTMELCKFYDNGDTGCQISGGSNTDPKVWPTNNYILNCESYNNVDTSRINADGFAAKLGVGEGNVFKGCISHNNADDGWDLYNKLEDGANCPVTIDSCIAYENGLPYEGAVAATGSIGNGFKLGGEGLPVDHVVKNCVSYKNNMDGFTCNFNPGKITVTNCTSFDNARCNFIFRSNPYRSASEQGVFTNCLSFRTDSKFETKDFISGTVKNSRFFITGNDNVTDGDFVGLVAPSKWTRNQDGSIIYGDFLRVKHTSSLVTAGVNGTYVGAIAPYKVDYTINFNANGGKCNTSSKKYNTGNKVEALPTPARDGYTFEGWYTGKNDGYKVDAGSLFNAASNQTVYAHWIAKEYKVTFNANGGYIGNTGVKTASTVVTFNSKYSAVSVAAAAREGYKFDGWYTKKSGGSKVTANTKMTTAGDVTLYAHFSKIKLGQSKVYDLKNVKGKKATFKAKKVSGAYGYQVRYSKKSNFKNSSVIKTKNRFNITMSKLSKGSKYYVQVRAYAYDSTGKKVYGSWSAAKKVTIKK